MSAEVFWRTLSEAYAFLGNSLLKPMSQTSAAGLDPAFWEAFPTFGDKGVASAVEALANTARSIAEDAESAGRDSVQAVSVEWTRLFVGPPKPAAAPWETFYRGTGDAAVGFGAATFEMRELLRSAGLELSNENNQYEDHMGIELLYLSVLCARLAEGEGSVEAIASFIEEHPLAWIGSLRARVSEECPKGYIAGILGVAEALLRLPILTSSPRHLSPCATR